MKCLSVQVYRQRILQGRYRDFTEILLTFVISINGSSSPVLSYLNGALHQLKHLKEFITVFVVVFAVFSGEFLQCLFPSEPVKA